MATTSPDGIVSPDSDQPVDWVGDWAATASSVQTALTNRATSSGTSAQRTSATGVREGTLWFDTTTQSLWLYSSGQWVSAGPRMSYTDSPSGVFSPASGISVTSFVATRVGNLATITMALSGTFNSANQNVGSISGPYAARTASNGIVRFTNTGYLTGTASIGGVSGGSSSVFLWRETTSARGSAVVTATYPAVP